MLMLKDFLIWLAIWIRVIMNISRREICSAREVSITALIEHTSQQDAVIWIVVHLLFALTAVANVWVATLSLVVKAYGTEKTKL